MSDTIPVLIVGAGPTGLAMALILQRHHIPFRLIEKKPEPTSHSNALGIHACTLEILEDLNVVASFIREGNPINHATFFADDKNIANVVLRNIESPYAYVLILPQNETENILNQHLIKRGVPIERNTELTEIKKISDAYEVRIKQGEVHTTLHTQWIVACDGAHSTVRKIMNIPFEGKDIAEQFVLADVKVNTNLPHNRIHAFYSKEGIMAFFPLPDGNFRILGSLGEEKKGIEEIDIQNLLNSRSRQKIKITEYIWKSTFWIHSKIIKNMQHDNIFFAGDAAHIHSPVGGQGMNSGIQDAYNLGWKLALVIKGKAHKSILQSYQQERYPIADEIVRDTDRITRVMLSHNPLIAFFRNWLLRPLLHLPSVNYKMSNRIAMLTLKYLNSAIIDYQSTISNRSPQAGSLVPYVRLLHPYYLTQYFHGTSHWLLIFAGKNPTAEELLLIGQIIQKLKNEYADQVKYYVVTKKRLTEFHSQLSDDQFIIHKKFNVTRAALCLIRPDKYIAYSSGYLNKEGLFTYLRGVFKLPGSSDPG